MVSKINKVPALVEEGVKQMSTNENVRTVGRAIKDQRKWE